MEGRDVKNDMAEIKRMLQQLAVRIYRLEARRRGRKSSDGERDVTTYHQRIDRIETFNQDGDGSDREICVGPFHRCAPLCESGEKGEPISFDYEGSNSIFTFSVNNNSEKEKKDGVVDFSKPPIYDDCFCEACYGNCGMEEDEDAKKDAIKASKKDTDHNFVDFLEVNAFIMQIPKVVVNIVNQINDVEGNFGIARLKLKRKFIGSQSSIYSKYLFIWIGRIEANLSKEDLKQWKILSGFFYINDSNSRTNSFQLRESDAGAYKAIFNYRFVIFNISLLI
ncbi:hypothetical protein ACLB2K_006318 [Fragaria x ananassa]